MQGLLGVHRYPKALRSPSWTSAQHSVRGMGAHQSAAVTLPGLCEEGVILWEGGGARMLVMEYLQGKLSKLAGQHHTSTCLPQPAALTACTNCRCKHLYCDTLFLG